MVRRHTGESVALSSVCTAPVSGWAQPGHDGPANDPTALHRRGGHRDPSLDALRGAAALAVLLCHTRLDWAAGAWGVDVFFVLSGYLITSRFLARPEPLATFYARRARRILPLYVVHVLVAVALGMHGLDALVPLLVGLGNVYPLPVPGSPLPSRVLWSVAVEEHFYVLWPALLLWAPRTWWRWALAMWAGAVALRWGAGVLGLDPQYSARLTPLRWDGLVLGSLLALAEARGVPVARVGTSCALVAATLLGVAVLEPTRPVALAVLYALLALGGAGVLLAVRTWQPRSAVLEWLGLRCYGVYLLHPFALRLVDGVAHPWLHAGATLAVTAGMAEVSWRLLEQPMMRWRVDPVPAALSDVSRAA